LPLGFSPEQKRRKKKAKGTVQGWEKGEIRKSIGGFDKSPIVRQYRVVKGDQRNSTNKRAVEFISREAQSIEKKESKGAKCGRG